MPIDALIDEESELYHFNCFDITYYIYDQSYFHFTKLAKARVKTSKYM